MMQSPKSEWKPVAGQIILFIEINEEVTSDRAKMFGIESRKCRFDGETTSDRSYPLGLYTQNLCLMECSVDAAINLCGCRPFFYKIGGCFCLILGVHQISTKISFEMVNFRSWANLQHHRNVRYSQNH